MGRAGVGDGEEEVVELVLWIDWKRSGKRESVMGDGSLR